MRGRSTNGPTSADDWRLIEAVAAGDPAAREQFCRRHLPAVRRWLRGRWHGTPWSALVGDAAQEVFLECLREGGALARVDRGRCRSIESYLHGVVGNVAARVERREARHSSRLLGGVEDLPAPPGRGAGPCESLAAGTVRTAILESIHDLEQVEAVPGHSLAELLVLHFREGQPVRRIAALWGIARGRVHEQRRRLCRRLRRRLRRRLPGAVGAAF